MQIFKSDKISPATDINPRLRTDEVNAEWIREG